MKRGTPDHFKTLRLQSLLGCSRAEAVGLLELLWHVTARQAPRGNIGRCSDVELCTLLHADRFEPCKLARALVTAGWLDEHPKYRLLVHDWHEHCDQAVRKWLQRQGLSFLTYSGHRPDTVRTASGQHPAELGLTVDSLPVASSQKPVASSQKPENTQYSSGRSSPSDRTDARVSQNGKAAGRGSRLPEQSLPEAWKAFAETLTLQAPAVYEQFCDYWRGVSGARGTKVDWLATWRNWCRTEARREPGRNGGGMRRYPEAATPVIPSVDATRQMLRAKGLVG